MTRKDFQLIADRLWVARKEGIITDAQAEALAKLMANGLGSTNGRFDHGRFIAAVMED